MSKLKKYSLFLLIVLFSPVSGQQDELSLTDAILKALDNNYGITISRSELNIAEINNNWGNAGRYPVIGFDASSNNSYDLADQTLSNRIAAGMDLNWVLFDGFRVNVTKSFLENTEEITSGRLSVMVENTIQDIILAYYTVLLEQERLEVLKHVLKLSSDRYAYELNKKSIGSSVTYEVLQAESIFLGDKAAVLDQEMRVRNAMRNFNFIITEDPAVAWHFPEEFNADTSHYNLSDLRAKMLNNNQTLKNQYTNLLLRQDETELKRSSFYPSVSTSLGMDNSFNRSKTSGSAVLNFDSYAPYANLRLSYDIYQGGIRKRAMEVARINEEIAQVSIEQMEHALTNELFNLYDYYEVRIALFGVANQSLKTAELNLNISEEKYRTGVINSFNYRDVQLIYLEASLRRLQAIYNLLDSKTRLTRITGGFIGTTPAEITLQ
ncbi:MAG: TolC family protein [Bacteroidales bacterium]|nr:TolC family protein [Bacteroidales bacterium]